MERGKWEGKTVTRSQWNAQLQLFSDRGIFLIIFNHVDNWWLLLIYVLCWPIDLWNTEKFLPPSASSLSTNYRHFASSLALPQASCLLSLLVIILLYICFLLSGLPFSFCQPGKRILVSCVLASPWQKPLHTKFHILALCSHRLARFIPLNTSHCIPAFRSASLDCEPLRMSVQNTYRTVPGTESVFKS